MKENEGNRTGESGGKEMSKCEKRRKSCELDEISCYLTDVVAKKFPEYEVTLEMIAGEITDSDVVSSYVVRVLYEVSVMTGISLEDLVCCSEQGA